MIDEMAIYLKALEFQGFFAIFGAKMMFAKQCNFFGAYMT